MALVPSSRLLPGWRKHFKQTHRQKNFKKIGSNVTKMAETSVLFQLVQPFSTLERNIVENTGKYRASIFFFENWRKKLQENFYR